MAELDSSDFAARLLDWWDAHGRKDLPWQVQRTPYRIWIAEVMLQQTQVATVVPYFERFTARFPTVTALATAELDDVLHLWSGLGYYARARNMHRAARHIHDSMSGRLPESQSAWQALPGIGRSTAAAIVAQAFGARAAILDGNVKRVLARLHRVAGDPASTNTSRTLWALAERYTPEIRVADYTQAIMDFGATCCTRSRPGCAHCPVQDMCESHRHGSPGAFPERRSRRRRRRERRCFFVLTTANGACYVERRPATGIWGGLWSPPERPPDETVAVFLASRGLSEALVQKQWQRPSFQHAFTHFDLDVIPVYLRIGAPLGDLPGQWIEADGHGLGVSAVAARLLREAGTARLGEEVGER